MKISIRQLKSLIRETIEEVQSQPEPGDELNPPEHWNLPDFPYKTIEVYHGWDGDDEPTVLDIQNQDDRDEFTMSSPYGGEEAKFDGKPVNYRFVEWNSDSGTFDELPDQYDEIYRFSTFSAGTTPEEGVARYTPIAVEYL